MTPSLDGKVALVTGAGKRVGRALAEALAECGARVAVHYRASKAEAEEVARSLPGETACFQCDLRDPMAAQDLPNRVASELGRLDVVVNSASVMLRQPFGTVTPEQWDAVHSLNLRAYFFVAQGASPHLKRAAGNLVNLSDLSATEAWPGYLPHAASKAGVEALTKGLARALAPEVRVNAIVPGAVLLPDGWGAKEEAEIVATTPLQRLGTPRDVANALLYVLGSTYTTGATIVVDGGRHLAVRHK